MRSRTVLPQAVARLLFLAVVLAGTAPALAATPPTLDELFAEGAGGRRPSGLAWSPDGRRLVFLWDDGEGDAVHLLEPARGTTRKILSRAALTADGEAPQIDAVSWLPSGDALLVEAGGDLWRLAVDSAALVRLTATEAEESDPKPSPQGDRLAFVRDHDLWLLDLDTGGELRLTGDGREGSILNGEADWVYFEELWNRDATGFWWSPDGERIAFYRFDERAVGIYSLLDPLPQYPQRTDQRYPKAGTPNPEVRLGVIDLDRGTTTWLGTGASEELYLPRVHWRADGRVAVERLNRDQTRLDLLLCDPADGACPVLYREEWPTWINLSDDFRFLADGSFLWSSEQSGRRRLYRVAADGASSTELTPEGWVLASVDGVDEAAGFATVTMFADAFPGARERRVFRQPLAGGEAQEMGLSEGWNEALPAPAGGLWVHRWSRVNDPGSQVVRDGREEVAALPFAAPLVDPESLPRWEWATLPGPGGVELPAATIRPTGPHADRSPVIVYHYGCPASQVVADRWSGRERDLWHRAMASRGYRVFAFDNTASLFFPKSGEDAEHRQFGAAHLPALAAVLEHLRSLPDVDPERIGIWGWSGGGSNTLAALLSYPGSFAAGVSGAPVTDWRLYDTIWTERYLDTPEENPEGYEASSPITHAANLADPLLVIHGTGDDNVHPQNTLALADRLIKEGKPFEMALYPSQKHGFKGPSVRHVYERMTEFFERHLAATGKEGG